MSASDTSTGPWPARATSPTDNDTTATPHVTITFTAKLRKV
jgi:hypothetical protein